MRRKTVLIVSPSPDVRRAVVESVLDGGYGVLEASREMEAVERAGLELPDMILIHVGAEGLDGWTALKLLSDSPRSEDVPVGLLAADMPPGERRKAQLLECAGVADPSDRDQVVVLVREVLGASEPGLLRRPLARLTRRRYRAGPVGAS